MTCLDLSSWGRGNKGSDDGWQLQTMSPLSKLQSFWGQSQRCSGWLWVRDTFKFYLSHSSFQNEVLSIRCVGESGISLPMHSWSRGIVLPLSHLCVHLPVLCPLSERSYSIVSLFRKNYQWNKILLLRRKNGIMDIWWIWIFSVTLWLHLTKALFPLIPGGRLKSMKIVCRHRPCGLLAQTLSHLKSGTSVLWTFVFFKEKHHRAYHDLAYNYLANYSFQWAFSEE